jgi:hypothetical protein
LISKRIKNFGEGCVGGKMVDMEESKRKLEKPGATSKQASGGTRVENTIQSSRGRAYTMEWQSEIILDRVSTGSDSDLVGDQHAI